jgi:hypothetical protein
VLLPSGVAPGIALPSRTVRLYAPKNVSNRRRFFGPIDPVPCCNRFGHSPGVVPKGLTGNGRPGDNMTRTMLNLSAARPSDQVACNSAFLTEDGDTN